MFKSCCCVSRKALKKQQENNENAGDVVENVEVELAKDLSETKCDADKSINAAKAVNDGNVVNGKPEDGNNNNSPEGSDKSLTQDVDKNGLISDGLVADISQQFSQQLDRLKSDDSSASNLTIVELPDPLEDSIFTSDPTKDVHDNLDEFIENVIVDDGKVIEESIKRAEEVAIKRENDDKILMQDLPKKKFVKRESVKSLSGDLNNHINNKPLSSCLSRRGSSRSSIKKKVVYNESAEVIPEPEYFINNDALHRNIQHDEDDDEVFSDNIPPPLPRGDMCTPFVARRGSIPGLPALPDWFPDDKWEMGGAQEPPTTPIGRDELAMKRHRFFVDLLEAAQAAVEHRVRFDPLGPLVSNGDDVATPFNTISNNCDPNLKPSTSSELENLIVRLEKIVDRLERTVSTRDLQPTSQLFNTALTTASTSIDTVKDLRELSDESSLPTVLPQLSERINNLQENFRQNSDSVDSQLNIPTVVQQIEEKLVNLRKQEDNIEKNMSVAAYEDILLGTLAQFLTLSAKIGDDVATVAGDVKKAFDAQLNFMTLASESSAPDQNDLQNLLKPTSDQIMAIQNFREKHRTSKLFNHLSAVSESIPALGWVCVAKTPGPHVKEMNDAGQFYTNRVLKEWKEKDATHVEWARSWVQTLTELQQYIKQYHTTGLVWAGKSKAKAGALNGSSVPPPPPGGMPPPPPPMVPLGDFPEVAGEDRNALFAQINRGGDVTKGLKKVTSDMQTHKNPNLREGPVPYKAPTQFAGKTVAPVAPVEKAPVFTRDGKKWLIEHQKNNSGLLVENAEMNNVVYMFKGLNSTLTVKGKINSVVIDSCKKCSVVCDSLVSSVEFVNCQSVQMQCLGKVPTIIIDKTDGCQMFLSKESLDVEIISSKSSEMNVMLPNAAGDDYVEQAIPEQFKTTVSGTNLTTTFVESLG